MILFDASTVAERWKKGYQSLWNGGWYDSEKENIYNAIVAANGDADKINAAIGNTSWIKFDCEECETPDHSVGVEFDNGDGGTVIICLDCLQKAVALASRTQVGSIRNEWLDLCSCGHTAADHYPTMDSCAAHDCECQQFQPREFHK